MIKKMAPQQNLMHITTVKGLMALGDTERQLLQNAY